MITFSSACLAIFDFFGCCTVISWQLMIFIVISRWVWSSLIGGCGLPLIFVSESWSLCYLYMDNLYISPTLFAILSASGEHAVPFILTERVSHIASRPRNYRREMLILQLQMVTNKIIFYCTMAFLEGYCSCECIYNVHTHSQQSSRKLTHVQIRIEVAKQLLQGNPPAFSWNSISTPASSSADRAFS